MKKLIVLSMVLLTAVVVNAAAFKWNAARIYGPDGGLLSGATAELYCDALSSSALSSVAVSGGAIAETTFNVSATAGSEYNFYYVITTTYDSKDVSFKSGTIPATASDVGVSSIAFGNQKAATQAAGAWGAVPEPTSALLMVLGIAGLALKRKRV